MVGGHDFCLSSPLAPLGERGEGVRGAEFDPAQCPATSAPVNNSCLVRTDAGEESRKTDQCVMPSVKLKSKGIVSWPEEERPRERLLSRGPEALSDADRPHLRAIIARALQLNASGMIAAHNHPSGMAEPSKSDRLLTRDLMVAALPLGVKVLDHVIISEEGAFSFADSGLLAELSIEVGAL